MAEILVAFVIFFAVFTQTAAGFGIALIAMPLLTASIGLSVAAPLVAIVALTCKPAMLLRYWAGFTFGDIWRLMLASVIGVMTGSLVVHRVGDGHIVEMLLGVMVIGYALFALLNPYLPSLEGHNWAYGLGFLSGLLARVYNIGGPPVVIYADGKRWQPETFKGNIQAYGVLNVVLVFATRAANGEFTTLVFHHYLLVLPAVALGLALGFVLEKYINPVLFRKLVLGMLLVIGLTLVF